MLVSPLSFGILVGMLLVVDASVPAHHEASTVTFLAGTYVMEVEGRQVALAVCSSDFDVHVGGSCPLTPPRLPEARITVVDDAGASLDFAWSGRLDNGNTCGYRGTALGSVEITLPSGCTHVWVYPNVGALRGRITVE